MEAPGLSLFQASDIIQIGTNSNPGQEEEEEQEDFKRRNEEIKDLLTGAFDDLEEDDASSINSSHYHDNSHYSDNTNSVINSPYQHNSNEKDPSVSQLQKDFGAYTHNDDSFNHEASSFHETTPDEIRKNLPDIQKEFALRDSSSTPFVKSNRINSMEKKTADSPYDLPLPTSVGFNHERRAQINDEYSFRNNYPYNYDTPSNHYDEDNNFPNNGYIDGYDEIHQTNQTSEYGGGDNERASDHFNHCYEASPNGRPMDDRSAYKTAEYNSKEQLEVLYSVRIREIQRLTQDVQQLRLEKEEEKNQLSRRLALAQAETERSNLSRNQAQNALVDAKAEIASLQGQVKSLKERTTILEKTNEKLTDELSEARSLVFDLQQKISVLERVQSLQANDKTEAKFLEQAQEKHAIEVKNMQTQIDVLTEKLKTKEEAYKSFEYKLEDMRRAHEALMVDKADTMNRLTQALEESQAQCHNLMANNKGQESLKLQAELNLVNRQKEQLEKVIEDLKHKLELAKSDAVQYDSLLSLTMEDETDSMRQLKLGEIHNKSKSKPCDDVTNKLRSELQRCLAGQAVKRKEINRLENTLSQREKELDKATTVAETCRQEAARFAKRVNELELELKSLLTDQAAKANTEIRKLSSHLSQVRKQYEALKAEKHEVDTRLEEALKDNEEIITRIRHDTLAQCEKEAVDEFNKEYLEIHDKAVERVRQEAQIEIVQLTVQLEQTQKELDRVKELYIDVCGTKEQLMTDHKNEIDALREEYSSIETRKQEFEKAVKDLETQNKVTERLTKECESFRNRVTELEKDLACEKKRRDEHVKKIHVEIERAKEEALKELRNSHPDHEISLLLPNCSEHLDKITQLEDDCKRLEEKLSAAMEEQKRMTDLQTELENVRLKLAQMEISQESWRQKYEKAVADHSQYRSKISKLESVLTNSRKNSTLEDSNDKMLTSLLQTENETLKSKCESLASEKDACKENITKLELNLSEAKKAISNLEAKLRRSSVDVSKSELKKELARYKDIVAQATSKSNISKDEKSESVLEQRVKQLEKTLEMKEQKLQRLRDLEKITEDRDYLIVKLKNQAKQFEQFIKNQKQVSAELNLSPRSCNDYSDMQKIKEITTKQVREEMEHRVAQELRAIEEKQRQSLKEIEEKNRLKQKEIDDKYNRSLLDLRMKLGDKTKETETLREVMLAEKMKLHNSFKAQEQKFTQMIEAKLEKFKQELLSRKWQIHELQEKLKSKENDVEEERNTMARVMTEWAAEIRDIKAKEVKATEELHKIREREDRLSAEIKELREKEKELQISVKNWNKKYQSAKESANNYKEYAAKKEKYFHEECKRLDEGYRKAMKEVERKVEAKVALQEEQVALKVKELESQYEEEVEKLQLKMKYKYKC